MPTGTLGNEWNPCPLVMLSNRVPMALFVTVTAAPGSMAPVGSFTVPEMLPRACANAVATPHEHTMVANITARITDVRFIKEKVSGWWR